MVTLTDTWLYAPGSLIVTSTVYFYNCMVLMITSFVPTTQLQIDHHSAVSHQTAIGYLILIILLNKAADTDIIQGE